MNYYFKKLIFFLMASILWCKSLCIMDKNWFFHTPEGTGMGLFLALALPTDILNRNVYLAYNFEVNYPLPGNTLTDVEYPPIVLNQERKRVTRHIDRSVLYTVLQTKLNEFGYNGHDCILKLICQFPMAIFQHYGIFNDLLHIILMPSSSKTEYMNLIYFQAEMNGHENNCSSYKKCPSDMLSIIFTWII